MCPIPITFQISVYFTKGKAQHQSRQSYLTFILPGRRKHLEGILAQENPAFGFALIRHNEERGGI